MIEMGIGEVSCHDAVWRIGWQYRFRRPIVIEEMSVSTNSRHDDDTDDELNR